MNVKRISAAVLTAAAVTLPVLAAGQNDARPAASPPQVYGTKLSLNGKLLDTARLPGADDMLLPMRLLCEADHGSAEWYPEDQMAYFYLDGHGIQVDFTDNSITVDDEKLDDLTATVTEGVTFLPVEALKGLEGITFTQGESTLAVSTSNGLPLTKLAWQIIDEVQLACPMKDESDLLKEFYGIDPADYEEIISFSPLMIRADTIVIGKYADGADKESAREALAARRSGVEQSFEFYLPDPYAMAQAGQVVESADGEYVMLVISEDNERAIQLFEEGVKALELKAEE